MTCAEYTNKIKSIGGSFAENNIPDDDDATWPCETCTFENSIDDKKCTMCGQGVQRKHTMNMNRKNKTWICKMCTVENIDSQNICVSCHKTNRYPYEFKNFKQILSKQNFNNLREYHKLQQLEDIDIIQTRESFECVICRIVFGELQGIRLRGCLHEFCKECISKYIEINEEAVKKCPMLECENTLQDREIMSLVSQTVYDRHIALSFNTAKLNMKDGFQCQTIDCDGYWIYDKNEHSYLCPKCKMENCTACRVSINIY